MSVKAVFDENGNIVDFVEETDEVEQIMSIETDPYWQSPIPKAERKHKRDKIEETSAQKRFKIALLIIAPIVVIAGIYYIILQFI